MKTLHEITIFLMFTSLVGQLLAFIVWSAAGVTFTIEMIVKYFRGS